MSEISEAAMAKARQLLEGLPPEQRYQFENAARYIQQVSDAAKVVNQGWGDKYCPDGNLVETHLAPFILSEPVDPIADAMTEALGCGHDEGNAADLLAALAKRGLKIVKAGQ